MFCFQCYSVEDMLTVFHIDHSVGADSYDFKRATLKRGMAEWRNGGTAENYPKS